MPSSQFLLADHRVRYTANDNDPTRDIHALTPTDGFEVIYVPEGERRWQTRMKKYPSWPDSWLRPVNWHDGTVHYRIEVLEKPDDTTITQVISRLTTDTYEGTHNIWLGFGACAFRSKGVHYFTQPFLAHRPMIPNVRFNWDHPIHAFQLVVVDGRGVPIHRRLEQGINPFQGSPDLGLYLPLDIRYTAVVVAPGAKFTPPVGW
jgi:hypothetical protein